MYSIVTLCLAAGELDDGGVSALLDKHSHLPLIYWCRDKTESTTNVFNSKTP